MEPQGDGCRCAVIMRDRLLGQRREGAKRQLLPPSADRGVRRKNGTSTTYVLANFRRSTKSGERCADSNCATNVWWTPSSERHRSRRAWRAVVLPATSRASRAL